MTLSPVWHRQSNSTRSNECLNQTTKLMDRNAVQIGNNGGALNHRGFARQAAMRFVGRVGGGGCRARPPGRQFHDVDQRCNTGMVWLMVSGRPATVPWGGGGGVVEGIVVHMWGG